MTIPISQLVNVTPSVEQVGGSNVTLNGLMLTTNTRVPLGTVVTLASSAAVLTYFGAGSAEYAIAPYYFNGFDTSTKKPGALLFAQCPYSAAVGAYLRGGAPSSVATLATFASGALSLTIDGAVIAISSISLTGQTSYSGIATALQSAIQTQAATVTAASFTASITTTTLTVTGTPTGAPITIGSKLTGAGITANTLITAYLTGTGGAGTYTVSNSQTVASESMTTNIAPPTVTFDSVSGAFVISSGTTGVNSTITYPATATNLATALGVNQINGAVLSQGAAQIATATIPAFMTNLTATSGPGTWAGFMTLFAPSTGANFADYVAFAQWANGQNGQYFYSMWDTNQVPCGTSDTTSAGYQINLAGYVGTICIGGDTSYSTSTAIMNTAAFALGWAASVNFNQTNGRQTLAYRTQNGLLPTVNSLTVANNLIANKYNYYGNYPNVVGPCFQNGSISGAWLWADSYINQIWLNNNCQVSLFQLMLLIGNIPYNSQGYALIRSALYGGNTGQAIGSQPNGNVAVGPIAQAVNFGAIRAGVILSANQIAGVNNQAGLAIDGYLNQNGWYLQIKDPGPVVREARGSPICTLWYMDGQSVQAINLASIDVL